jgi:small-conductance mechanosensitive channel
VTGEPRTRRAGVLVSLALATWWAEWVPAVLVAAFVIWLSLHVRLEGGLGDALLRRWRRVWPLAALGLVALLFTVTLVFWVSTRPLEAKVVPIALNLGALWMICVGRWSVTTRSA